MDLTYKINNRWRSIETDFQDILLMALIAFLPINAANTVSMIDNDQITLYLPGP